MTILWNFEEEHSRIKKPASRTESPGLAPGSYCNCHKLLLRSHCLSPWLVSGMRAPVDL